MLMIGKIVTLRGLKGELKVYPYTQSKERFEELDWIYIDNVKYRIKKVSYLNQMVLLTLDGVNDVDIARKFIDREIYIDRKQTRELEEDEYLIADLIGCSVFDQNNVNIGKLVDVLNYASSDIYVVKGDKEILIPAVIDFVKNIDIKNKNIYVFIDEGLL
jgi:16S rRNA processing protein RimM